MGDVKGVSNREIMPGINPVMFDQYRTEAQRLGISEERFLYEQMVLQGNLMVSCLRKLMKLAVLDYWNGCAYCGEQVDYDNATLDHVIPRHANGRFDLDNIVPACQRCNSSKRHDSAADFMRKIGKTEEQIQFFVEKLQAAKKTSDPAERLPLSMAARLSASNMQKYVDVGLMHESTKDYLDKTSFWLFMRHPPSVE